MDIKYNGEHYIYLERVLATILIYFYALIIIGGANSIRSSKLRYGLLSIIFAVTLIGSISMLTVKKDKWSIWLPNPDWRTYAADIKNELKKGIVFTSAPPMELKYYLGEMGEAAIPLKINPKNSSDKVRAYIKEQFQEHSVKEPEFFYIAINRYWDTNHAQYINSKIIRWLYPLLEERHYLALDVYKYGLKRLEDE
jgi:hypothetical protein